LLLPLNAALAEADTVPPGDTLRGALLTEELGDKIIDDFLTPSVEEWGGEGVLVLHLLVVALCLTCKRDFDALSHVDCSHGSNRRDPSRLFKYDAAPLYDLRRSWLE